MHFSTSKLIAAIARILYLINSSTTVGFKKYISETCAVYIDHMAAQLKTNSWYTTYNVMHTWEINVNPGDFYYDAVKKT